MTTSITNLRGHLEKYHAQEYVEGYKAGKWELYLPKLRKQIEKEQAASSNPRIKFSPDALVSHLVKFIVGDNQVSLPWLCQ